MTITSDDFTVRQIYDEGKFIGNVYELEKSKIEATLKEFINLVPSYVSPSSAIEVIQLLRRKFTFLDDEVKP